MVPNDIVGLIVVLASSGVLIALAAVLLSGRGAFLIAGYNTMSKAEKARWDERALCRFMGKVLLPIGVLMPLVAVAGIFDLPWLATAYGLGVVALCAFAVIYCNTGNRFRRR